jgi:hypothetical protein
MAYLINAAFWWSTRNPLPQVYDLPHMYQVSPKLIQQQGLFVLLVSIIPHSLPWPQPQPPILTVNLAIPRHIRSVAVATFTLQSPLPSPHPSLPLPLKPHARILHRRHTIPQHLSISTDITSVHFLPLLFPFPLRISLLNLQLTPPLGTTFSDREAPLITQSPLNQILLLTYNRI